ncbi:TIGR01244 family protein [Roseobacter cerasinus]|uniref:TIGR01244 family protein n=1 Tax=Roseobacter cerasinus TaxID=2602289 RepID=A0A640VP99_9RHOB|nr:TIGR01244 family sulfur transferase [Roseobacter cerasinus]GFE49859.1 TIGR01244 family protein [Roseobacter cerasinus]
MDMRQITSTFFAAPQISPEDMPDIAAAGIKRILCNRPDAEVPPSHHCAHMQAAAEAAGLEFVVQPLTHQTMTPDVIAANRQLIDTCNGPVLAYCASGTRSTIAWALAAAQDMPVERVIEAARTGGYDLRNLQPTLMAVAAMARDGNG